MTDLSINNRTSSQAKTVKALSWIISFAIPAIAFMCLLFRMHYSVDSYHNIANPQSLWHLSIGRYTMYFMNEIVRIIGLDLVLNQHLFLALAIIGMAISIHMLGNLFAELSGLKGTLASLSLYATISLIWANVFVMEYLLFPEIALEVALGAPVLSAAVVVALRDDIAGYALSVVLFVVALGCYQSYLGYYLALCFFAILTDGKNVMRRLICVLVLAGICAVLNVVIMKLSIALGFTGDSGRHSSFAPLVVLSNMDTVLAYQLHFWFNADGLLPVGEMQLLLAVLIIAFVVIAKQTTAQHAFFTLLVFIVAYASAFAAHYVSETVVLTPRSVIGTWASIGALLTYTACLIGRAQYNRESMQANEIAQTLAAGRVNGTLTSISAHKTISPLGVAAMMAIILCLQAFSMADIAYEVYASNALDVMYAQAVADVIKDHEEETGVEITSIAICGDTQLQTHYPGVIYNFGNYELNRRIMNTGYSNFKLINYVGGLNLESVEFDPTLKEQLFGSKNWDCLDLDEQLVFVDNTAYLALY